MAELKEKSKIAGRNQNGGKKREKVIKSCGSLKEGDILCGSWMVNI